MIGKAKEYIISERGIEHALLEMCGHEAKDLSLLSSSGIQIPSSFVLSTSAFDDFITAAGLVEPISLELKKVDPSNPESANRASEAISQLILTANFPSLIIQPLIQAYKTISGGNDKFVALKPSYIFSDEYVDDNSDSFVQLNVKGEAALLYHIKKVWVSLFSKDSLIKRARKEFHDDISMAVIVQRMVQAEVTGRSFSHNPITGEGKYIEIQALLGIVTEEIEKDMTPDLYLVDSEDLRITEKTITAQEYMIIKKGRAKSDEDPNLKVEISADWQKKQKMADHFIIQVSKLTKKIEEIYKGPVEVHFAIETGSLFVLSIFPQSFPKFSDLLHTEDDDVHGLQTIEMDDSSEPTLESMIDDELGFRSRIEIIQGTEEPELPETSILKEPTKRPNITSLAKEISDMARVITPNTRIYQQKDGKNREEKEEAEMEIIPDPVDIGLQTDVLLDVTDLDSDVLSQARSYDGGYLDGSAVISRHLIPVERVKDKAEVRNLSESYSQEIVTAAKVLEPNFVYYSFSNPDTSAKQLLGLGPDSLDGCERFLLNPEALQAEVDAIRAAKQTYQVDNIHVVLPKIRGYKEITDMKKLLNSFRLHRNNRMRLFVEIATPALLFEISKINKGEIDGFVLNLKLFAKALIGRSEMISKDHDIILNAISTIKQNNTANIPLAILMPPDLSLVDMLWQTKLPIMSFIFTEPIDQSTLISLKKLEARRSIIQSDNGIPNLASSSGIGEKSKKGRKIKLLFGNN